MPADHQMSQANLDNPVEIIICGTFAAPRELVWLAWTDPHHAGPHHHNAFDGFSTGRVMALHDARS